MLRCAITDGNYLVGDAERWAYEGVDFVQIREKTLDAGELADLGRSILRDIAEAGSTPTKLLINGRADVAVAIGAAGVHLTAHKDELTPQQVRSLFVHARLPSPVVSVSCHTPADIASARHHAADLILFGPVFEKRIEAELVAPGVGIEALALACAIAQPVPLLALGGITSENAAACMAAGAAGIAGIRTFA